MKFIVSGFVLLSLCVVSAQAQQTVLDGVYSDAQAARGQALYTTHCSRCHGDALEGVSAPELTGNRFLDRWRETTLEPLYDFINQRMPLGKDSGAGGSPIRDNEYLDILTHVLKINGYRSGSAELTPALLPAVILVGKNGPQPVPDGALITTVGCLSQARNGVWVLANATEPVRTRTSTTSTPAELKVSLQKTLGQLIFRLADLDAVPKFSPEAHKGQKIQAKGFLVRQPNAERISLSSLEILAAACEP